MINIESCIVVLSCCFKEDLERFKKRHNTAYSYIVGEMFKAIKMNFTAKSQTDMCAFKSYVKTILELKNTDELGVGIANLRM